MLQEEECSISLWPCHYTCPRLAQFDLPMVPRERTVNSLLSKLRRLLTCYPTETQRNRTRLTVFFWERTPQDKRRTIFKLRQSRSQNVTTHRLEQINLTERTMMMNVENWVDIISLPRRGYKLFRKLTMKGKSTEPDICPKTLIWSRLKLSPEKFWFSIAQSIPASQRGEEFANPTSGWLGNIGKGMLCKPPLWRHNWKFDSYGLAWNPVKAGHILGASEDMTVCCWWADTLVSMNEILP